MCRLILPALLLVLGLAACDGEDPVDSVVRDVSTANHAAAAVAEAEAAAKAEATPAPVIAPAAAECDVEVSFGSYGAGPDAAVKDSILKLVSADPGVTASQMKPWGREGETTLCLTARDEAAANRLYGTLAAQLPSTSTRAPTTVRHRDGRSRATTYPAGQ
ncbi:hypothetical protein [Brevundimonas goettingensis]|uniref:Lipoprotein n=1 Tax=Brevundimonas goettingensis TaxID=2774190 RepID=A0A975C0P7_9CAUL|nr:hypothetical protein [Brevundimonas goettingensis]QTC91633.1 hypothetical protein IFJ75_01465 [Brevundimonas goettingensis]